MYLPTTIQFDGASPTAGFSTRSVTATTSSASVGLIVATP
jgi:hypothetical protein